jgi:hypothetical protein
MSLALPLLLAVLAVPTPAAVSPWPAARDESFTYAFASDKELADFQVVSGRWSVSTGQLWCTTNDARAELAWRRALSADGSVQVTLAGAGRVAIALRAGEKETLVRVDRAARKVAVECDGKPIVERLFEAAAGTPMALAVRFTARRLDVRVGDDEAIEVARPDAGAPFEKLALLSFQSQPRFDDLVVHRDALRPAGGPATDVDAVPMDEELRIAVERATERLDQGDVDAAFDTIAKALPRPADDKDHAKPKAAPEPAAAHWPDAVLALLQQIGARKPALVAREPLASAAAGATVAAKDGSAKLTLPLRRGWKADTPDVVRTDATLFVVHGPSGLTVTAQRYDQKLTYWFGRDPKLVYTKGGGGPTLGKARADEQKELHAKSEFVRAFDASRQSLGGETTFDYELAWSDPQDATKATTLREYFALRRGDTWRLSIEGASNDVRLASGDLDWIVANFRFASR